ncbi:MAG: hypothetical protein HKN04_01880 [Rhodothermaceae bacterium]|nr:hypothetical protein [Rhodothermaceae bacterium]
MAARVAELGPIALVALQLGLLLLTFNVFDLERGSGFVALAPLILGGFVIHAVLPMRLRMPFFLALSLAGFWLLLGPPALILVGLGLGLIGICHLPINLWARVGLLVAVGVALAMLRVGAGLFAQLTWGPVVMPVLGSMFMFRLIIYLYDLQHEKVPATIWERLSYFFLLPNACFLLFPVVDYQTFRRTYYDTDAATIYQKGVFWMFRGMTHLLLYRILYYYIVPNPTQVVDLWTVVLIVFGTYLLYLKVSGLFHLIIGTLGLFGFNLPETYHRYLLASGFNDFWRRSNIYWKDFMMKVFYYPMFMRLRKRKGGMVQAVGLATAGVFLVTWLLHSYQWFWLLGAFPLTITDVLFWSVFGGLVVVNSVSQLKAGKKGSLSKPVFSFKKALTHALKVMGMLIFIAALWSFWYSPTPAAWLGMLAQAGNSGPVDFALLGLIIVGLIAIGVGVQYANSRGVRFTLLDPAKPAFSRAAMVTSLGVLVILGLGQPQAQYRLGGFGDFVGSLQEDRLTEFDAQQADKGYYEALMTTNSITAQVGGSRNQKPPDWKPLAASDAVIRSNDLFLYRLRPSSELIFKRAPMTVNQWGMRDQEYTREKPDGTYRIALLGASIEMGAGVLDDETYEAVAEARLNAEQAGREGRFDRYEILNFSIGGYSVLQHLPLMDEVVTFQPDLLLYTGHTIEDFRMTQLFIELVQKGIDLPPHLEAIRQQARVDSTLSEAEIKQRLEPFEAEILHEGYTRIVAQAREVGARPIWLFVPRTEEKKRLEGQQLPVEELMGLARDAGFTVLSIGDAYDGIDDVEEELFLAPWDDHPNVAAHQLLGNRLYEELIENGATLGLTGRAADTLPEPSPLSESTD